MSEPLSLTFEVEATSGRMLRAHVLDQLPALPPRRRASIELAASELAGHVVEAGADTARVTISSDTRSVVIDVVCEGEVEDTDVDPMRARVLDTVTDSWWVDGSDAGARLELRPTSTSTLHELDERELFERLATDTDAGDILFEKYAYLADRIGRRYRNKGPGDDDVRQVANLALVKAMGRFDVDHGSPFASFAARTISGELKRFLRDRAWSVRVPRSLQEQVLEVTAARTRLTQRLGREPTPEDVADETGLEVDEVLEAMSAGGAYRSDSLDAPMGADDDRTKADSLGGEQDRLELAADWSDLQEALSDLDERDLRILRLRFYDDRTQTEIAEEVGVSQMHVSRLIRSALETLRVKMGD